MKAIISDIHGNLEALHAVLEDAARSKVDEIYCLGDLVGYGPNPRECLDLALNWKVVVQGNFDRTILNDPPDFGPTSVQAARSLIWSRQQVTTTVPNAQAAEQRWEFLTHLSTTHAEGGFLFVHGSARNPLNEYVFPEDIYNRHKLETIFAMIPRYCFQGHTHVPGVFSEHFQFHRPEEINHEFRLGNEKSMVNVGSVGAPRDGDARASYVVLKDNIVRFRRVEYDWKATLKKIRDIDDLDDFFGDRLGDGR
jgi:predicted phosphodiesterase